MYVLPSREPAGGGFGVSIIGRIITLGRKVNVSGDGNRKDDGSDERKD